MKRVAGSLSVHFLAFWEGCWLWSMVLFFFSDARRLISLYYLNIFLLLSRCGVPAYSTFFWVWLHDWVIYYWWLALDHVVVLLSYIMFQTWHYYASVLLRGNCKLLQNRIAVKLHCSCCIVTDSLVEQITVHLLWVCTLAAFRSPEAKFQQCLPHWKFLLSVTTWSAIHHLSVGKQLFVFVFL